MRRGSTNPSRVLALLLAIGMAGCDTSVELLSDDGLDLFALHGFVDSAADTQYVRIEALRPLVKPVERDMAGVTVSSTRLDTGARVQWAYAPSVTTSGAVAHVYRAVFDPEPGATYRIEVERSGTPGAVATAQMPPLPTIETAPAVLGDGSFVTQAITLSGVTGSPLGVRLVYYVRKSFATEVVRLEVDYGEPAGSQGGRFLVTVYPSRDRGEIMHSLGLLPNTQGVELVRIALEYDLLSPEWTSGSQDPGLTLGHGFFAARGVYESSWRMESDAVAVAGFVDAQGPG